MRIAYVSSQYPPRGVGGIGTFVASLARVMAGRGHEVVVVSAAPGQQRSTRTEHGVRVERFPLAGPGWLWAVLDRLPVPSSRVRSALSAFLALRRVEGPFDVVEAPEWRAEGLMLRRATRGAVVIHLHIAQEVVRRWVEPGRRPGRSVIAEWLERRAVRRAHAVTAATALTTELPGGSRWVPRTAVSLVPPPLEPEVWAGCTPVAESDPVVLFLGHRERRKAPEVAVEAAAELAREVPHLRVVLAGRTSTSSGRCYDDLLREQAERLAVDLELLPPVIGADALRRLYSSARVVVVPSRYETLSMVALEALLTGRPAVVTSAVGAAELIGPFLPELVVPVDDPAALADALRPFLVDARQATAVGLRGQGAVRAMCRPERVAQVREDLYLRVAGAAPHVA